jgi:hypothetical protein
MRPQSVSSCVIVLLTSCTLALASGCASKPEVVASSGPRKATTPDQVKIYQKAPKKYEALGTVTVAPSDRVRWDERGNADEGFEQFKSQVAARGANGLLLEAPEGSGARRRILAAYKGEYYQVPVRDEPRSAVAQAIWVLEEK